MLGALGKRIGRTKAPVYIMTISQSNIVGVATGTVNRAPLAEIWSDTAWGNLVYNTSGSGCTNRANSATAIGPELAFAEAAAQYHGRKVYIIKLATASTSLDSDWLATNIANGASLASALTEIAEALAALTAAGIRYEVMGGMSMIGETEAGVSAIVANRHGLNYRNAIKKVRDAVGKPYMPWVIARPYANGAAGVTYMNNIRTAELEITGGGSATITPANLRLLDTDGFARTASNVHFTEAGYNSLGTALFNAVAATATTPAWGLNELEQLHCVYLADRGVTYDGSNDVSQWNDASGAQYHMGQSGTAAAKPNYNSTGYGSKPAITFTSTTMLSTGTTVGDASVASRTIQSGADNKFSFAFVLIPQSSTFGLIASKYGGAGSRAFYVQMNGLQLTAVSFYDSAGTNRRGQSVNVSLTAGQRYTVVVSYDGSLDTNDGTDRIEIFIDGVAVATSDYLDNGTLGNIQTTNFAPLAIGAACATGDTIVSNNFVGDLQAFIHWGADCSEATAALVDTYLSTLFNIT